MWGGGGGANHSMRWILLKALHRLSCVVVCIKCAYMHRYTHTQSVLHKWNHVLQRFYLNGHLFEDRQDINAQKHLKAVMCQKNEMNCIDKDATQERSEQELTDSLNKSRQTDIL